ncbi:MAG: hypothetical protein COA45_06285 [Zetaproteobacteria bacterium]|nr:MAG: hypothetical protein COA45_06285 [Zetaproteobacteria bacterium]
MSEVNATDLTKINSADDVFALYAGSGDQAKVGIEVELPFINPQEADLPVMSQSQNIVLKDAAMVLLPEGDWIHNEPTSELLEVVSKAAPFSQAKGILKDINNKIKILSDTALGLGLKRSYFQELPDRTADDLLSRIMDVERYNVMYAPYRADMKKCVQYFAVCKSNQVSVSPYNMNHMLENVRRLYLLAPFLFLMSDNSVGFNEGKPFAGHAGMSLRHHGLLEGRGGILPYVFTAASGEEFISNHIDHVFNNPLFMYYDEQGSLIRVPSGDWSVTPQSLKGKGLNTASNFFLSESLLWPDVKIAALKNDAGEVNGHRFEARMFGVGVHQHQTAFILTAGLAFNQDFARGVDALLAQYGFTDDNLSGSYDLLLKSYASAREHSGQFFDISYGTGTMAEFAKSFADLVEIMANEEGLTDEVVPILTIFRSGCTDAKVNRILCPTLEDVMAFQQTYDTAIFDDPNLCARTIFAKEIEEIGACKRVAVACS